MLNVDFDINGAVVFWRLAQRTDRNKLVDGLTSLGLSRYAPKERTPYNVLAEAVRATFPQHLVRPLNERKGFTALHEEKGDTGNRYENRLIFLCAEFDDAMPVVVDSAGQRVDLANSNFPGAYRRAFNELPANAVGSMLARIATEALSGTRSLRDAGGIYWIPAVFMRRWSEIGELVEHSAINRDTRIYSAWTASTPDTIRAIRDSIIAEIKGDLTTISEDLKDPNIGPKAIAGRRDSLHAYSRKLAEYEQIIGESLVDVRTQLEETRTLAVNAELIAAG